MKLKRNLAWIFGTLLLTGMSWGQSARPGQVAPSFQLKDSHGDMHQLSDYQGKTVVLEWINFGCPFVKKHYNSGNMQKLQKTYGDKGVVWLSICSSAPGKQGFFEGPELEAQVENHKGNQTAYLIDSTGEVGKEYGARTTPHMFVIDPAGKIVYAGGIDDKPSVNPADIESAKNFVAMALDAVLKGEPVPVSSSQPYGCSVKY